ncbi:AsmA family protein [Pluralibacter gergoviae]|uniref:AsmA family protein n=1 Tax=Pluralibacter gergoviae TaxID=61647 RepID=UPI002882BA87|nr:AsmA family protein [Pluralibacter gergoviae]ELK5592181.1 AsmA family protein [Pluralibacter gergoviae]MDU4431355.1 AsmA family protein [Pluralibacter gergoviae]
MKFIGKLLLWLAIAALLAIVLVYFMLQTRWGARQLSGWVSENSGYRLSVERMEHHFSSASRVELINVTFGRDGRPATLVAKRVEIGLSSRQLTDPLHADTITLRDGTLNLSPTSAALPFQADALRLNNMAIHSPESGWDLSAQRVTGGVAPWQPEAGNVLGKQAQVQMSAGSMTLNGVAMSNVLVQGDIRDGVANLTTVGADIARGSLTGSAKRGADGSWQVSSLRLSDVRLQSDKSLANFFAPLAAVPSLAIDRLEVTDASLQGPDWAVTDLDLSLRNLTLSRGGWQSEDGRLSMNANEFIYGSLNLLDPIVNAELSPQGVNLRQFTSRWERGIVRTSGRWLRDGGALQLDDLALAGLEYTLPDNWRQLAQAPLPDWLQNISLKHFSASRNLLIDITPDFPWQITSLEGYGDNLQLAQDGKWGIWGGTMSLNGAAATFNRVDVRRPSLKLAANASTINVTDLSAFVQRGLLQCTAVISQLPQRQATISLNGRGVPLNTLQAWGWPALNIGGEGNLQLRASASLQPGAALKPTVNGELHAVNAGGQQATQVVRGGEAEKAQPAPVR